MSELHSCFECKNHDCCTGVLPNDVVHNCVVFRPKHEAPDNVNHPAHYETGKFECIDVMGEALGIENQKGFCLCNAFKYLYRCTKKHSSPVKDVKKAVWYLNKFLELEGEK